MHKIIVGVTNVNNVLLKFLLHYCINDYHELITDLSKYVFTKTIAISIFNKKITYNCRTKLFVYLSFDIAEGTICSSPSKSLISSYTRS